MCWIVTNYSVSLIVMCEGEAIWNACLGTTARAVNVDLPINEVHLLSLSHDILIVVRVWVTVYKTECLRCGKMD